MKPVTPGHRTKARLNQWNGGAWCLVIASLASAVATAQQPAPAIAPPPATAQSPRTGRAVGADQKLPTLMLVRSAGARAVVRFGTGPLETVTKGDRLGTTGAAVIEVTTGRLVLEELAPAGDGRPNRTLIVFKDGETGGKRYLAQPDENPPTAVKPVVIDPAPPTRPAQPAGKPGRGRP